MEHAKSELNDKTAKQVPNRKAVFGKNDSRYWIPRVYRPINDRGEMSPHYAMRIQFKGRRFSFGLGTANKDAASKIAAGIYGDLLVLGPDATLHKHRPKTAPSTTVATIGEWIAAARRVSGVNPSTFNCYSASLRLIAGQILAVSKNKRRFGPRKGGAREYRNLIDRASLDILTLPAIQKWRLAYVAQAKSPVEERSRMTSCNSTIRQARSLFAGKITKFIPELLLPTPPPFHGVDFFPRQNAKYFSRIDPKSLLQAAHKELASKNEPAFLAMLLALSAGLRRGEIDSLSWDQVDFRKELIRVEPTESANLKTRDSRDEVHIDAATAAILKRYQKKAPGRFVIEGPATKSGPRTWGNHYRVDAVFNQLNEWLRSKGVKARKPLHELRKELGALVTAEHGIYAASRVLRHSNVATTAAHYSDLKSRPIVNVGGWLDQNERGPDA